MSMMSMKHFHTFSADRSQLQAWICHASHAVYPQQGRARSWAPDGGSQFQRFFQVIDFFPAAPMNVHPFAVKMRKTSQFVRTDWLMMFLWEYIHVQPSQDWKIEKQQHAGSCFSGTISKKFHASFVTSWSLWRRKPQIKQGIFIPPSQFRTLLQFLTVIYVIVTPHFQVHPDMGGNVKKKWRLTMVMVTKSGTNRASLHLSTRLRVAKHLKRELLQGLKF